jgi:preprotein translocase subunit YajC
MTKKAFFLLPSVAAFAQDGSSPSNYMGNLVFIGIMILFFYFIMWRPEQKRRKAADAMRNSLKKGDRVTAMGIIGKVDSVNEQTVILKMVDNSKIEMLKAAITDVQPSSE